MCLHGHRTRLACADTHAHLHAWLRWAQAPPRQLAVRVAAAKKQQQQPKRRKAAKRGGPSPPRRDAGGPLPDDLGYEEDNNELMVGGNGGAGAGVRMPEAPEPGPRPASSTGDAGPSYRVFAPKPSAVERSGAWAWDDGEAPGAPDTKPPVPEWNPYTGVWFGSTLVVTFGSGGARGVRWRWGKKKKGRGKKG
mmetsp:Transcript_15954/g.47281  ORF Transcript_15954/g.47281 Transcript_15954/m.47281 type:complete len:193 (-) Transcript_15954:573-1151(-)